MLFRRVPVTNSWFSILCLIRSDPALSLSLSLSLSVSLSLSLSLFLSLSSQKLSL